MIGFRPFRFRGLKAVQGEWTLLCSAFNLGTRDPIVKGLQPKRPARMEEATYAAMPKTLVLREARVGGWTLVTPLIDAKDVHKQERFALYRQRGQVELGSAFDPARPAKG